MITFYARKTKPTDKHGVVWIQISFNSDKIRKSTKLYLPNVELHWSDNKRRVLATLKQEYRDYNLLLDMMHEDYSRAYRELLLNRIPVTKQNLEQRYKQVAGIVEIPKIDKKKEVLTFQQMCDAYLKQNRNVLAKGYTNQLNQVSKHILDFMPDITWEDFTLPWWKEYQNYLIEDVELVNATIKKHHKWVRNILKFAKTSIPVPNDYVFFTAFSSESFRTSLDWDELMKLYNHKFIDPLLQRCVDIFLIVCFVGIRRQDYKLITPENIHNGMLRFTMHKTQRVVSIALSEYAIEKLEKYNYQLPVLNWNEVNKQVKEACRLVEINQDITIVNYSGSGRREHHYKKYQLVSMHVARHTFACINLANGMPLEVLSNLMGHRSLNTTLVYAKINDDTKQKHIADVWKKQA